MSVYVSVCSVCVRGKEREPVSDPLKMRNKLTPLTAHPRCLWFDGFVCDDYFVDCDRYFSIFALYVSKNCVFFFAIKIEIFDTYRYFTIFGIDNYRHEKASIAKYRHGFRYFFSIIIDNYRDGIEKGLNISIFYR